MNEDKKVLDSTLDAPVNEENIITENQEKQEDEQNKPLEKKVSKEKKTAKAKKKTVVSKDLDEDIDESEEEDENEEDVALDPSLMYSPNMLLKLKLANDKVQQYYSDLRNEILSYSNVKFRSHTTGDVYLSKGKIIIRVTVFPKVVKVYFGLSIKKVDMKKYHLKDASKIQKYEQVPVLLRVSSDRSYKYAIELVELLMSNSQLKKKQKNSVVDYTQDFLTNSQELLELQGSKELLRNTCTKELSVDLSDKIARNCVTREVDPNKYESKKTAEITIGELSAAFRSNSVIDINLLRATELIEEDANYVKVIALGKCSKPLTVKANDFDIEVIKMLVLTGGNVIKVVQ